VKNEPEIEQKFIKISGKILSDKELKKYIENFLIDHVPNCV